MSWSLRKCQPFSARFISPLSTCLSSTWTVNTCRLQVSGFPVFGTAQPTEEGFLRLLDKIPKVRRRVPPPSRQDTQCKGSGWYTDKRQNDKRQNDKHQNEQHQKWQTSEQFYQRQMVMVDIEGKAKCRLCLGGHAINTFQKGPIATWCY